MRERLQTFASSFTNSYVRASLLVVLVLGIGVFTTVYLLGQRQDVRQRASEEGTCSYCSAQGSRYLCATGAGNLCSNYNLNNCTDCGTPQTGGGGTTTQGGGSSACDKCLAEGKSYSCSIGGYAQSCNNTGQTYIGTCTKCTASATPTPTPTTAPTATPTPTRIPDVTSGVTPTNNPTPTCTPRPSCLDATPRCGITEPAGGWCQGTDDITPTSSVTGDETKLNLVFTLTGIGNSGTSSGGLNNDPVRKTREVEATVYNGNLVKLPGVYKMNATYSDNDSAYHGTLNLGDLPTGNYLIKLRTDNSLFEFIPGIQSITGLTSNTTTTPSFEFTSGDIIRTGESDNFIDVFDYNALLTCLNASGVSGTVNAAAAGNSMCGIQTAQKSDLNDDDILNSLDLNILLRAFLNRQGD